jgi:ASC-1-like (ASCH) protein
LFFLEKPVTPHILEVQMKHMMTLYAGAFDDVKSGKKTREYRLYDEKRRKIKQGDTIEFFKLPGHVESVLTKVKRIRRYKDWYSCYTEFFDEDLRDHYSCVEAVVRDTYENWWTKEKEEKYGCLIIEIEKL